RSTLFPYTTLFRSRGMACRGSGPAGSGPADPPRSRTGRGGARPVGRGGRLGPAGGCAGGGAPARRPGRGAWAPWSADVGRMVRAGLAGCRRGRRGGGRRGALAAPRGGPRAGRGARGGGGRGPADAGYAR